jgi:Holliday junction resolvase RusA-like endonuclease
MSEESKIVDSLLSEVVIKIDGLPAPGGSKTAFVPTNRKTGEPLRKNGRIIVNVTDAGGKRTRDWKRDVARQAKAIFSDEPWTCQIEVEFHFMMPRLKSHYGTGAKASLLRLDAPRMHGVRPDLTKLIRAVEDACTGILWFDDALIVRQLASKRYGERPGVQIAMRPAVQNNLSGGGNRPIKSGLGAPSKPLMQSEEVTVSPANVRGIDRVCRGSGVAGSEFEIVRLATASDLISIR